MRFLKVSQHTQVLMKMQDPRNRESKEFNESVKRTRVGRPEGSMPAATLCKASRNSHPSVHLPHSRNVAGLGYNFSLDDRGHRDNRSIFLRDGTGEQGRVPNPRLAQLTNKCSAPLAGSLEVHQCPIKRSGSGRRRIKWRHSARPLSLRLEVHLEGFHGVGCHKGVGGCHGGLLGG